MVLMAVWAISYSVVNLVIAADVVYKDQNNLILTEGFQRSLSLTDNRRPDGTRTSSLLLNFMFTLCKTWDELIKW